ncbi:hypothetical protein PG987_013285 [Apiospora arundinis]
MRMVTPMVSLLPTPSRAMVVPPLWLLTPTGSIPSPATPSSPRLLLLTSPPHGYTRGPAQPTLPNQSNHSTAVTADHDNGAAPVYSSVDSQSRARTEAPDPAFSDSVEAQVNGETATAKAPMWWQVDEA